MAQFTEPKPWTNYPLRIRGGFGDRIIGRIMRASGGISGIAAGVEVYSGIDVGIGVRAGVFGGVADARRGGTAVAVQPVWVTAGGGQGTYRL